MSPIREHAPGADLSDEQRANLTALIAALIEALAAHEAAQRPQPVAAPDVPAGASASASPALISVPEAANRLGISRSSAYRLAEAGELPTRRLGGRVYVIAAQLNDLIEGKAA